MKDLRRNEFIDMLEMADVLFEEKDNYISCDIPTLGKVTYYPKSDKINVHVGNKWLEDGFRRVKVCLNKTIQIDQAYIDKVTSISERIKQKSNQELRNEFAGLAMQSLVSNGNLLELISGNNGLPNPEYVSNLSYELADAMVKRSKL